jgi:P27 family predicted phage terminase small subunit
MKDLAGNPGKRPLNDNEPKCTSKPTPPEVLSLGARAAWDRTLAGMPRGVYTSLDSALLAAFCVAVANWEAATLALKSEPQTVTGSTGQPVLNPLFKHQSEQARLIESLGARLGLNPVARQSLTVGESGPSGGKFGIH